MSQSGDVLQRFFDVLIQQITVTRPEYLAGPFTVAEIYQDLVPYRSHRDLIGVEMNADYEHALVRMLAGEGECLLLDSEVALRELREELNSPNPNTTVFREFAAVDVRLHPSRVPLGAGPRPEVRAEVAEVDTVGMEVPRTGDEDLYVKLEREPEVDLEMGTERPAGGPKEPPPPSVEPPSPSSDERADGPGSEPATSDKDGVVGHIETVAPPPPVSLSESVPDGADATEEDPSDRATVCHWCREDLPVRDSIRFCPFCGSDLRPSPCRECGEAMQAQWQFCASCGTDVRG